MTWESERRHATEGVGGHGWTARISWILGVTFAIIGVITEVADTRLLYNQCLGICCQLLLLAPA